MTDPLAAIGAQADGIVRSVQKLCTRIYGMDLPRGRQHDVLHAFRRSLNHATRYHREPGAPLEKQFSKPVSLFHKPHDERIEK